MNDNSKVIHQHGDNTPCDSNGRCEDYQEEYKAEIESATKPRQFYPINFKGQVNFPNDPNNTLRDTELMKDYATGSQDWRDYHALYTIVFGELIDSGFDWGRNDWPCYNETIRTRLVGLIEDMYRFREICEAPPAKFKHFITRRLKLIMPKYNKMYELLENNRFDVLETGQHYNKDRDVYSEYPQSQLSGSADYASNANDKEGKGKTTGNVIEMMNYYAEQYQSIDQRVVKELEVCFYSTTSGHINSY